MASSKNSHPSLSQPLLVRIYLALLDNVSGSLRWYSCFFCELKSFHSQKNYTLAIDEMLFSIHQKWQKFISFTNYIRRLEKETFSYIADENVDVTKQVNCKC